MKLKLSFRLIVTLLSIIAAIILGGVRIIDPQIVEVMRLKYFDQLQKKYPRSTDGQTYSVIVDIDEASLREIGQWPWPRTVLADLFDSTGSDDPDFVAQKIVERLKENGLLNHEELDDDELMAA